MGINTTQDWINDISDPQGLSPIAANFVPQIMAAYPDSCADRIPTAAEVPCHVLLPPEYGAEFRRAAAYFGDAYMIANRRGTCQTWVSTLTIETGR